MISGKLSRSEIESLIDEWIIGRNAQRDREIIKRRLIDGICFEPLAEDFRSELEELMREAPNEQVKQKLQMIMTEM